VSPLEEGDAMAGPRRVADLIAVQIGSDLLKSLDKSWCDLVLRHSVYHLLYFSLKK